MADARRAVPATTLASFPEGAVVFSAGERADRMYVVQDGAVDVLAGERFVRTVGPGGILGEMALINHLPRSATARAKYDTVLKVIDEQQFLAMVRDNPAFALEVMRTLAARLRDQTAS